MAHDPIRRPRERESVDVERDTGTKGEESPKGEGGTSIGPEDEERRVRPGENRPDGHTP